MMCENEYQSAICCEFSELFTAPTQSFTWPDFDKNVWPIASSIEAASAMIPNVSSAGKSHGCLLLFIMGGMLESPVEVSNRSAAAPTYQFNLQGRRELPVRIQSMIALLLLPMFAAAGYSLIYLLFGGGFGGAVLIFIIAKMLGK
jgi:CHASE1-domain containing sensor protein